MLSPRLRRQIYELWTMFWSSGMTNPLTAIEQITYLLFLKQLQPLDETRSQKAGTRSIYGRRRNCTLRHHPDDDKGIDQALPEGADPTEYEGCHGHGTCRWEYISQGLTATELQTQKIITPHDHLSQYVFPWLRELEVTLHETGEANGLQASGNRMADAYFQLAADKTATLQRAIKAVDDLFRQVGQRGANADLMGDIFEYLLLEIKSSGKNGQFRTPRHIIRFMIQLLDPKPDVENPIRIVDPAAGTGGFLINTTLHMRQQLTDPPETPEDERTVVLEWDGTPRRALMHPELDAVFTGDTFTGYDNDRTMVRIGWMNLVLHGIESPNFIQRDTLGKSLPNDESDRYDFVLANPPFTGTVDKDDLHETRFPRNKRNAKNPITTDSELLFIWLMLKLLRVGGRAAVIVPEGVLFGSTGAHKELRRTLLLEHELEGVISLPAGVFQPYTGVKTSILVFKKAAVPSEPGLEPYTSSVWFYEVSADGYSLNAKRDDRPTPNDLWDALVKWPQREPDSGVYFQPQFFTWRFRPLDEPAMRLFHDEPGVQQAPPGYEPAIHELFPELDADPEVATAQVVAAQGYRIRDLFLGMVQAAIPDAEDVARGKRRSEQSVRKAFDERQRELTRAFSEVANEILEKDYDDHGRKALTPLLTAARQFADAIIDRLVDHLMSPLTVPVTEPLPTLPADWKKQIRAIVREFAMLDGYDVRLRTRSVQPVERADGSSIQEPKCWTAAVRSYARDPEWRSTDGSLEDSHDEDGTVRDEYIDFLVREKEAFESDGTLKSAFLDLLDPDCIEANDFNLSAGRYKPVSLDTSIHRPPREIILRLQTLENEIQDGLTELLAMVEGEE